MFHYLVIVSCVLAQTTPTRVDLQHVVTNESGNSISGAQIGITTVAPRHRPVSDAADTPGGRKHDLEDGQELTVQFKLQEKAEDTKKEAPEKAEKAAGQPVPDKPPVPKLIPIPMRISGRALDPDSKPLAGATIYLQDTGNGAGIDGLLAQAKTDRDGRYEFPGLKIPVPMTRLDGERSWTTFQVFGKAPGYAFTWQSAKRLIVDPRCREVDGSLLPDFRSNSYLPGEKVELDLKFQRPRPVTGRIVDEKGKPIPGFEVTMTICDYLDKEGKEPRSEFRGLGVYAGTEVFKIMPDQLTAKTDAAGRFEFPFTPPEIWGMMWLEHPEFSTKILNTITSDREMTQLDGLLLQKSPIELTIPRPRRVTVQVRHSDTGASAAGVFVSAGSTEGSIISSNGKSNDKGQILLRLPPGKYRMFGFSEVATRYLPSGDRDLIVADDPDEQTATLQLDPGCVVTFKVVEAESGKPIPGLSFWSAADKEAALARRRENVRPQPNVSERASVTNQDGKCTVIVKPGKLRFGYFEKEIPDGYVAGAADDHTLGREVVLDAGKSIEMEFKLQKPGGKE
jgi:hypothetical protein